MDRRGSNGRAQIPRASYPRKSSPSRVNRTRISNTLPPQKKITTEPTTPPTPDGSANNITNILGNLDLTHLSEEERNKLLNVVQRDLHVRGLETERLKRYRTSILRRDREVAAKSQTIAESSNCVLCGERYLMLINPRLQCMHCKRSMCRRCSENVPEMNGPLCRLCLKETGYRAMRCQWFYDTVINRFREFGSTTVAKSIFGDKYKQIQNIAEDELASAITRTGVGATSNGAVQINEQKVTPQSTDRARDVQVPKLRKKLQTLMQSTLKEYQQLDEDDNLTTQQKQWQSGRIGVEFQKAAAAQMRAFSGNYYLAIERSRVSQGKSSRHITKEVISTLRDEVSQIVGHQVKDPEDNMSIASDDDLESVAFAEREGVEERFAQELLDKVLQDRQRPTNSERPPSPIKRLISSDDQTFWEPTSEAKTPAITHETIIAVVGAPTRMEVKLDFDETCEFNWFRQQNDGTRKLVKFDFRLEHAITGSSDPDGKENFVLSNSGHFGTEAMQSLIIKNRELRSTGAMHGVTIQHQLIIWAAQMEDAGLYVAVTRTTDSNRIAALQETEFELQVQPEPQWPLQAPHAPEFLFPLAIVEPQDKFTAGLQLSCVVAGNPAPRCLFYRNNAPIPVVIMPLLTNEQDRSTTSLSSFSRKYTIINSPYSQPHTSLSVGYLRTLTLQISNPNPKDVDSYTCKSWNTKGSVVTSLKLTNGNIERAQELIITRERQASLEDRLQSKHVDIIYTAKAIEGTARTHGDVLSHEPPRDYQERRIPTNTYERASSELCFAADQTLALRGRIIDLERKFYSHSCAIAQTTSPKVQPVKSHRSTSSMTPKAIVRPFRMCLGLPREKRALSVPRPTSVQECNELRSQLSELVDDVFVNEERVHTITINRSPYPEKRSSYPRDRPILITRTPELEISSPSKPRAETYHEPPSPSSSSISDFSFRRNTSRRSTGPKIVIDRRSHRRKNPSNSTPLSSQPEDRKSSNSSDPNQGRFPY